MKHYIIVKYKDSVHDQQILYHEISELFSRATQLEGVTSISLSPAILVSEKRYDLMICIDMKREALEAFDLSDIHRLWKENYSQYIAHKAIFDCE